MRILIVGGTMFMGPFVARLLHEQGHEVAVFHRGQTEGDLPGSIRHIHGDRRQLAAHADEIRQFAPEVALDMILENDGQARELLDVIRGVARRVVAASSQDVYRAYGRVRGFEPGPPDPTPLTEDSPLRERLRPHGDDYEKILVERVIMGDPDLPGTILRLPAVYGPGDPQNRLHPHLKRMDDNRPAILVQDNVARWRWSRGYAENMASAIALAVTDERAASRIYNVAEPDALSSAEWVRAIGNAAGWRGEIVALPRERLPEHLRNSLSSEQDWVADSTRIRRELGYREHVSREEALARTVAWERANPPAQINPSLFDYAAEDRVLAELKGEGFRGARERV
ncbi:MAG: NAD-dependent epimerase/dehydratase family protein [Chloroflexi bacterium]|nr:NAD-dependent epimerase/dehydratase family protein [Chloroflexota bacterium]